MNRFMMIATLTMAQVTQFVYLTAPAYALSGDTVNLSTIRHQAGLRNNLVRIEGELICGEAAAKGSENCGNLKIQDAKTGKSFNLTEADAVLHLYKEGSKKVAIEGSMEGSSTITVKRVETL